jgi:hypothetical protein
MIPWARMLDFFPRTVVQGEAAPRPQIFYDFHAVAGMSSATGAGLSFSTSERATWRRNEPATFSDEATPQFKIAVQEYRTSHPYEAP